MNSRFLRHRVPQTRRWWLLAAGFLAVAGLVAAGYWVPGFRQLALSAIHVAQTAHAESDGHNHAGEAPDAHRAGEAGHNHAGEKPGAHADEDGDEDEHGHAAPVYDHKHEEASAIKLSQQARGNIGLQVTTVALRPFDRTITVPGIVVERPGWSVVDVTAPMTGVVTRIYPIQGECVDPGRPLFEVRLTHEDLLQAQTEFLRNLEELDVTGREVARLEKVSAEGVIPGKTLLERKYEQQKQEAAVRAQRQALLLHGLSEQQVDEIIATRKLLQSLTIYAPAREASGTSASHPLRIEQLVVSQGKHVNAGDTLCTLVDSADLYIEGRAFEQDIQAINGALTSGSSVAAALGAKTTADEETVQGLRILYLDDKVDQQSRAFHFYVTLPNRVVREDKTPEGRRFVYWQFKAGQRVQIRIPVEQWKDRIVLPVEAVAQDGAEAYAFELNGDHFDRRPVHVEYRDQDWVVIANDGAVKVGATVASSAAHQMQLALKNKAGGGVDPHAGHNH